MVLGTVGNTGAAWLQSILATFGASGKKSKATKLPGDQAPAPQLGPHPSPLDHPLEEGVALLRAPGHGFAGGRLPGRATAQRRARESTTISTRPRMRNVLGSMSSPMPATGPPAARGG